MSQEAWRSRGDDSELLFGDAFVERGLDGRPGVSNCSWWVVRVVVEVFDERSCVECLDGLARITSKELAITHFVKSGTLQNAVLLDEEWLSVWRQVHVCTSSG